LEYDPQPGQNIQRMPLVIKQVTEHVCADDQTRVQQFLLASTASNR
jgi:hypothetical protein